MENIGDTQVANTEIVSLPTPVKKIPREKVYKNPLNYAFNCECGKNFNLKKHFNAHKRKVHSDNDSCPTTTITKAPKMCPICTFSAKFRFEMIRHFEALHNITFPLKELTFQTENEFLEWKKQIEIDTVSRFVIKEGTRLYRKHKTTNYDCHRSGYHVTSGKSIRSLKIKGSVKMNGFCPARISKYLNRDGTCVVTYLGTHIGHKNELKFLTLSSAERADIAEKMASNIPFDDILENVRDSHGETVQRVNLLTRQDLYNIEASFNLQSKVVRHKKICEKPTEDIKEELVIHDCIIDNSVLQEEINKNTLQSSEVIKLKEDLQTSFQQTLDSISTVEECEVLAGALAAINSKLAAVRNQSASQVESNLPKKYIILQRTFTQPVVFQKE